MLFRHLRTHQIFGANTEVGKTVLTTALCRAASLADEKVSYLKPVGTGDLDSGGDPGHVSKFAGIQDARCLFQFQTPVSPHLAVERDASSEVPTDDTFAKAIRFHAEDTAARLGSQSGALFVESAGGVHSPTLSGSSQADAYRPLRLPTILIAAHHLGGISTTLAAYESLTMRGFDVDAVLCMREEYYENWSYLSEVFGKRGIHFATVSAPAPFLPDPTEDEQQMREYYQRITEKEDVIPAVIERLQQSHTDRLSALEAAPREARQHFWWPFLQHQHVQSESQVMNIDSAYRDCFETFTNFASTPTTLTTNKSSSLLQPTYDGSASWWTQCLGHSNPDLALAAAYAAGRYGHVIFPQAVYEPALNLSKRLLATVGKHWASKVFFSDDGSTGMEVALKMALRAYSKRYAVAEAERPNLGILGLKGSYHGDTIGSMDASEKSVYSKSVEWYRGRGFWLDPPTVAMKGDHAAVSFDGPQWHDENGCTKEDAHFRSLSEVYDVEARLDSPLARVYREHILSMLHTATNGPDAVQLGALVLEPVVMGAGGMLFVDPLFQRILVDTVRSPAAAACLATGTSRTGESATVPEGWANLPVVFDEVFVGLYRLGKASASEFLGCNPDVACFAKILTGGLVPMSVTLASQEIYNTFLGPTKVEALLHGHSYTAHPVGCSVANKALELLGQLDMVPYASQWLDDASGTTPAVWSLWDKAVVEKLVTLDSVESAMALGCVLAIKLVNTSEVQGYSTSLGADVLQKLRPLLRDQAGMDIHTRPLGDVLYVMSSLNTSRETLAQLEDCLVEMLL